MIEDFIEFDCFISLEPSNHLQILNNAGMNAFDNVRILESSYKYQVPEMEMLTDIPSFENFRKSDFQDTNTKIKTLFDESLSSNNKFGVYFDGGNAHFVPISRPILKSYAHNVNEFEYKKVNFIADLKINNDEFCKSCTAGVFKPLTTSEKIRQPFIPSKFIPFRNDLTELRGRTLSCYGQEELTGIEYSDIVLENINNVKKDLKHMVIAPRKNPLKKGFLESEVLNVMLKIKIEKFSVIMKILKDNNKNFYDDNAEKNVILYLPTIALMIRGLWVIKSEVLYRMSPGGDTFSNNTMCLVRDYVLCLFHAGIETTPTKIKSVTKISSIEATELLKQFANPITNSNSGKIEWKYNEIHYTSIHKYQDINDDHNRAMLIKTKEVCSIFKLDSLLVDSSTSKRRRSLSQQYELVSLKGRCSMDLSPTMSKRARIQSISSELTSFTDRVINESETLVITSEIEDQFYFNPKEVAEIVHMKEEPTSSQNNDAYYDDNNAEIIKTELSEIHTIDDIDQTYGSEFTKPFPSKTIYENIKDFIGKQFNVYRILPVHELATKFYKNNLSTLPSSDYISWKDLDYENVIKELVLCICKILDEFQAKRIDIEWPKVSIALSQQVLYLSNNKAVLNDEKFINKILELMKINGSVNITDLKKGLSSDKETKHTIPNNNNLLRDKVEKYCHYRHRKYFLKYTVS